MEAAGIEPACDSSATDEATVDCVNGNYPRAAHALRLLHANRHEWALNGIHCQSVYMPEAVIRIAESWDQVPPHIRDAIETLVEATAAGGQRFERPDRENGGVSHHGDLARQIARECRSIIQPCLREEEWQDAEEEFFEVIKAGLTG